MSWFVLCTIDDSDSYVSDEEEKDQKTKPEATAAPAQPTVPLGADFGTC